jgi:hypothetical protein
MRPRISMRESLTAPKIFGRVLQGESWYGWRVLLIASAGEELTDDERIEFKRLTGRDREPGRMCRELICVFGRRAGKSRAMTVFSLWIAALNYHDELAPGEKGIALIISRDQRVSKIILDYAFAIMLGSEPLRSMIANKTADSLELTNNCVLEVRPCSHKNLRGPTYVSVCADEVAQWYASTDFANPDVEVLTAVRPGLLTTRGPLLMVSSAYAKSGVLYDSYKKYFGPDGPDDIIVAYGTSRDMNPSLPQSEITRALERDPVANRAEYLSEWRDDVAGFIGREIVERQVGDYIELPPHPGISYRCFIDQASGVPEGDSFVAVVAHKLGDRVTIDAIREVQPPFNFFEVVQTVLLPLCKTYKVYKIVGDSYAGELARAPVRKAGIGFELARKHKSEFYADPFLGMLNAGGIDLPRNERAVSQICQLERSLLRSGREQITHPTHGKDDIANAIAGAVDLALNTSGYTLEPFDPNYVDPDAPQPGTDSQQPELLDNLPQNLAEWWRWKGATRQKATYGSADENLMRGYRALAGGLLKK